MSLVVIHERLADSMILLSVIAGIWGLIVFARRRSLGGNYWGVLAVTEILILAQALLGFVLWIQGGRPGRGIHLLYGVVAVITLPAAFAYLRAGEMIRALALTFGLVCLFLAGIGFRAIGTGL